MVPPLLHVAPQVDCPGGMGAIIRRHRATEPDSAFIGLFDRPRGRGPGRTAHLGARAWTTPRRLRKDFCAAARETKATVAVYHNAWGAAALAGLDQVERRVAFLHTDLPDFPKFVRAQRGLFDGVICLSEAMREVCLEELPGLARERTVVLALPVETPPVAAALDRPAGKPLRLGYAGRLERTQKRLDRARAFFAELDVLKVSWQFDFLGDGSWRGVLEREFAGEKRVRFLGWRQGLEYWRALAEWDGIVFFSDFEASPLTLHEALRVGVIPFFPRLGRTQGEVDAALVDARSVYQPGEMASLAAQVRAVFEEPAATLGQRRQKAAALMSQRDAGQYERRFSQWIESIAQSSRLSVAQPRGTRWTDGLPIGLLARICPDALRA